MGLTSFPNGIKVASYNGAAGASFTIGTEAANAITVNVQLTDGNGDALDNVAGVMWYLADDSAGDTPTASAPDTSVAAGTDGSLIAWTAAKNGIVISESDGDIDIVITHAAGAATWYLCLIMPSGERVVSSAITFA